MIYFVLTRGHAYTVEDVRRAAAFQVQILNFDQLFRKNRVNQGTFVFTDLDRLSYHNLDIAADLYQRMQQRGLRVLNDPAKVKIRYSLLRALHRSGINQFNVYRADELVDSMRYPVFVRKTHGHRPPVTPLISDRVSLDRAISDAVMRGVPLEHLMVIEYAAQAVRPGVFRKLSAFRIGDAIVPHISVHDDQWLVKSGKILGTIEDLYEEESHLLRDNPFQQTVRSAFEIAQIEYGRADFGMVDGRVQFYEINTNPQLGAPGKHPSARRTQNVKLAWGMYLDALSRLDRPRGPSVELAKPAARITRYLRSFSYRTRWVP